LILAHERLHVAVFDRYADEVVATLARPRIARRAARALRRHDGRRPGGPQAGAAGHLDAFMERARGEATGATPRSTPRQYERMTRTCGGLAVEAR
jgi:hypothetical protein